MAYDNPRFWDSGHLDSEVHRVFENLQRVQAVLSTVPVLRRSSFKRIDALDPHQRAEAEGKHLEGGMVEEHEAKKLLEQVEVHTESPVRSSRPATRTRGVSSSATSASSASQVPVRPAAPSSRSISPRLHASAAKMARGKQDGIAFRERFLGATDAVGTVMTKIAPLANAAAHKRSETPHADGVIAVGIPPRPASFPRTRDESFPHLCGRGSARRAAAQPKPCVAVFATC